MAQVVTAYEILRTEPYKVEAVPDATEELEDLVEALLPDWQPLGGPQWIHERIGGDYRLLQAMVQYNGEED